MNEIYHKIPFWQSWLSWNAILMIKQDSASKFGPDWLGLILFVTVFIWKYLILVFEQPDIHIWYFCKFSYFEYSFCNLKICFWVRIECWIPPVEQKNVNRQPHGSMTKSWFLTNQKWMKYIIKSLFDSHGYLQMQFWWSNKTKNQNLVQIDFVWFCL